MIEGTWLDVVAAEVLLDVEVSTVTVEGSRACRGRSALGGGNWSREGVDGRGREGVETRSEVIVGGALEGSGDSARTGLRGRRALDVDREAPGVDGW